jgi:hypothetical protein
MGNETIEQRLDRIEQNQKALESNYLQILPVLRRIISVVNQQSEDINGIAVSGVAMRGPVTAMAQKMGMDWEDFGRLLDDAVEQADDIPDMCEIVMVALGEDDLEGLSDDLKRAFTEALRGGDDVH